jgi:hypothetical protein
VRVALIVDVETAVMDEPRPCPLDDPPAWQHLGGGALDATGVRPGGRSSPGPRRSATRSAIRSAHPLLVGQIARAGRPCQRRFTRISRRGFDDMWHEHRRATRTPRQLQPFSGQSLSQVVASALADITDSICAIDLTGGATTPRTRGDPG